MLPQTVMVAKKATIRLLVSKFDLQAQPSYGFTQPDDEGVQLPIAYESRKLTASERKYSPYVLEMLVVTGWQGRRHPGHRRSFSGSDESRRPGHVGLST